MCRILQYNLPQINYGHVCNSICAKSLLTWKVYWYVDMLTSIKNYVSHGPTWVPRVDKDIIIVVTSFFVLTRRKMVMEIVNVCVWVCLGLWDFFLPHNGGLFSHNNFSFRIYTLYLSKVYHMAKEFSFFLFLS